MRKDEEDLYGRAIAHEADGHVYLAIACFGAARGAIEIDLQVFRRLELEGFEIPPTKKDEWRANREQLSSILEHLRSLRAKAATISLTESSRDPIVAMLAEWHRDPSNKMFETGAIAALTGLDASLAPLLAFVEGSLEKDEKLLTRALDAAPDSAACAMALVRQIERRDRAAASSLYEKVLTRLRHGEAASSPAAQMIARVAGEPTLPRVLEPLAVLVYEQGDRKRALELAEELVKIDPRSYTGWMTRAHCLLFDLRYEDAVRAYDDAIAAVQRSVEEGTIFGKTTFVMEPRPLLHFNQACALGRLEQKKEALEALRQAVRGDAKYAEDAKTEDWLECLWGLAEFEAITRRDAGALATPDELTAPFIKTLISRAKGFTFGGAHDKGVAEGERAVALASKVDDPALIADALSTLAYSFLCAGNAGRAVELSSRAAALSETMAAEQRAEIVATHAAVLQAHGDLDGAERAHHQAISLRSEAHGAESPIVAKSYCDLSGLYEAQRRSLEDVRAVMNRAIEILTRYLEGHSTRDDVWIEAMVDRYIAAFNLACFSSRASAFHDSVAALRLAVESAEIAAPMTSMNPAGLKRARSLAESLAAADAMLFEGASALARRFEALGSAVRER